MCSDSQNQSVDIGRTIITLTFWSTAVAQSNKILIQPLTPPPHALQLPPSPHWRLEKKEKPPFLKRSAFFHTEIAEIAIMFFCAIQLASIILKNFDCDAIIPVVQLFWCIALDVDNCRKSDTFLSQTNGLFFERSLPKLLSYFFSSVQHSILIWRNFYYDAMQQLFQLFGCVFLELHFCHQCCCEAIGK